MINKIILARKDAEMQRQQERLATAISGRLEAETEVSKLINQRINATKDENKVAEYNTIVLNDQLTLLQKITQLREAGLDLDTESTSGFNSYGAGSVTDFQSDKVGRLLNWINQERKANEELNNIMSERQKLYSSLDTGDSGEKVAKGSSGTVSSKKADKTRSAAEDHIRDLRKMTTDMVSDTEKNIAEADDEFNKWLEERLNDEVMASLTKPFDISVADKQGLTDYNYWLQNAYDGQLEMLRDMHEKGLIGDKEYADKSTKITAQANSEKLATFEGYLNASMDLANVVLQFQEAAKNRELKAAGDDAKKKEEIEKQYAEKQKQIAIAQAIIQGVLEVAKIWTAANVNIPLGVVLTGIAAARTVASVALISSQKFDKGGYTPAGAWDEPKGTVHSNEWVGNRFAVTNPNVRQFLDVFDRAQRTGQIRSLNTRAILAAVEANRGGYAGGGYTPVAQPSSGPTVFGSDPELKAIIAENARAIGALRYQLAQGIEAFMVASKFDKFQNDLDVIRKKTTLS
jgi:hypothetical protein